MRHMHTDGYAGWIDAAALGLDFTRFRRLSLRGGVQQRLSTTRTELCLVVVDGMLDYVSDCSGAKKDAGSLGPLDMLFLPPHAHVDLAGGACEAVAYEAPSELGADYAVIRFQAVDASAVAHRVYGDAESGCLRHVWHCVDAGQRCSRLMLGICEGHAGGWTAWPPHEHGVEREELYFYFDMRHTFGIQCVYEQSGDPGHAVIVRDGDLVSIDKGFHPNVGAPAGRIKYIYCMTARIPGDRDFMKLRIQPEFGERFA